MAHLALYRKWRPLSFDDVVEQRHIVETLKNSVRNNSVSHAYLFCGTRGTGKTTLAKILSRAVNCMEPVGGNPCNRCDICKGILDGSIIDVIEIDAASNNGVDDVRQIREAAMYVPAVTRFKVYIIDEVHMLSAGAFNALLKTLEEPPQSVIFILATTESHKLPATILSRCQRFDFKRITIAGIISRLETIAKAVEVDYEPSALTMIARLAQGGLRDAISILDQCIATGTDKITRDVVIAVSGLAALEMIDALAEALADRDVQGALALIDEALSAGKDLAPLCGQLVGWFRNLMLFQIGGDALKLVDADEASLERLKKTAERMSYEETIAIIRELSEAESRLKWSENQRILMEVTAVRVCARNLGSANMPERMKLLESRLGDLERKLMEITACVPAQKPAAAGEPVHKGVPDSGTAEKEPPVSVKPVKRPDPGKKEQVGASIHNELEEWPRVLEYLQSSGKMKVYAYLIGTRCYLVDDSTAIVVVGCDEQLKKNILCRRESIEAVKEALNKVTGISLKVKVRDEAEMGLAAQDESGTDPVLEKVKRFAMDNGLKLDIKE
ncbi:MAG: DNA polymerase III subunit gamma/tau [Clostridiaceae bacterium]|nr:DNA polymerase III subunit gamma/tau [Clostridiaceae bacterium]